MKQRLTLARSRYCSSQATVVASSSGTVSFERRLRKLAQVSDRADNHYLKPFS